MLDSSSSSFFLPLFLCIVVVLDARARSMHVVEIVLCKRRIAENLELRLICNGIWMGKYRRGEKKFGMLVFFPLAIFLGSYFFITQAYMHLV